jgi:energy-coupling factor transport system ATP-binding protein
MFSIRNATFSYEGTADEGIRDITLDVAPGECVVLAGESGCGKTTLLRCINNLAPRFYRGSFSGEITLSETDLRSLEFADMAAVVGTLFQDPRSQFFSADPLSELSFVCENLAIDVSEIRRRVEEAVAAMRIGSLLGKTVFQMSGGERQMTAVASIRSARPQLYLMDEPSANLDVAASRRIAEVIATLKREGAAVLVSEHKLWYLRDVIDRLVVIRHGSIAAEYSRDELLSWDGVEFDRYGLRRLYPEHDASTAEGIADRRRCDNRPLAAQPGPLLNLRKIVRKRQGSTVLDVDEITINRGEFAVIVGPNGAGKTTLARIACGLDRPNHGTVMINGRPARRNALSSMSYYFSQDCDYQLFADSVAEEILLTRVADAETARKAEEVMARLGLEALRERHPASLSRGQKQRVCAACALMKRPALVVLDEPTSGLDAATMGVVGSLFRAAADDGAAIVAITHDYEFATCFADRVIVMELGRIEADYRLYDDGGRRLAARFFGAGQPAYD